MESLFPASFGSGRANQGWKQKALAILKSVGLPGKQCPSKFLSVEDKIEL